MSIFQSIISNVNLTIFTTTWLKLSKNSMINLPVFPVELMAVQVFPKVKPFVVGVLIPTTGMKTVKYAWIDEIMSDLFLVVDINTITQKDFFPTGLLLDPLKKIGFLDSKYITECLVVFKEEKERIESIESLLKSKGIKCYTRQGFRRKINPL